jgi:hypothetical protein
VKQVLRNLLIRKLFPEIEKQNLLRILRPTAKTDNKRRLKRRILEAQRLDINLKTGIYG